MEGPFRSLCYGWVLALLPFAGLPLYGAGIAEQIELARKNDDSSAEIELLRRLLDQNPNDTAARARVLRLWLAESDFTMAESALGEWKNAPVNLSTQVKARVLAERDDKWDDAISLLQTHLKESPKDGENTQLLSTFLARMGRWQEQLAVLDQLIAWKAYASYYLSRAKAKKQLGDYEGAIRDAKKAKGIAPDEGSVKSVVPVYERLASVLPMLKATTEALKSAPENVSLLLQRGSGYQFGDVPAKALEDSSAAAGLVPVSIYASILKARAMSALRPKEDSEIANEFGVNLGAPLETPAVADSLIQVDAKIAANGRDASLFAARSHLLNADQQFGLALADAETAFELDAKNGPALLEAIYACGKLYRADDASAYFRRLDQAKVPNDTLAIALGYLVESNFSASNYTQTLEFADRALKMKETESMLRYKSQALRRLGNDAEADAVLARAEKLKAKVKK